MNESNENRIDAQQERVIPNKLKEVHVDSSEQEFEVEKRYDVIMNVRVGNFILQS